MLRVTVGAEAILPAGDIEVAQAAQLGRYERVLIERLRTDESRVIVLDSDSGFIPE